MTREEAIRILASSCIPGSKQTEALETLIPELAESEDERIREWLVNYFETISKNWLHGHVMPLNSILTWLEKQKEQKPAKWGEEDEKMLKSIDLSLDCYSEGQLPALVMQISREREWLKSLRPSWKPSEEQMEALDKAIPVCMGVVGRDEIAPLESLYEQLKKLM